jgi:hypothetical protein
LRHSFFASPLNAKAIHRIRLLAPQNRGNLLDIVVFVFNLSLLWIVTRLSQNLVRQAETDRLAMLAVSLFFAGLLVLQPLGPILKRWSFHQRNVEGSSAGVAAGCLITFYIFPYIVIMLIISLNASLYFLEAFRDSQWQEISYPILLGGIVMSFVNAVLIYRYFLTPKRQPRWKFLTTPQAEWLGDTCTLLNVICFQILWSSYTASPFFSRWVTSTPLGKPGSLTDLLGRLILIGAVAMLVYFPPRIFYLVEDKHLKLTLLTMLLANLPLIIRIVVF